MTSTGVSFIRFLWFLIIFFHELVILKFFILGNGCVNNSLNRNLFKSIANSFIGRLGVYIVQFASLVILSRIFVPTDFGMYAAVFSFFLLFQLIGEAGLGPAIINEGKIDKEERNNLFGNVVLFSIFVSAVFFLLSGALIDFYGFEVGMEFSILFSLSIFFYSINVVPLSFLQSEKKFITISMIEGGAEIFSLLVVFALCLLGKEPYYLALKLTLYSFIRFTFIFFLSAETKQGRPNLSFKAWVIPKYWKFAKFQVGHSFVSYFSRNVDTVFVAKFFGAAVMGPYDRAYHLMRYPLILIAFSIAPAIQPVLRDNLEDREKVITALRLLLINLFLLSGIVSYFMYANAELIILIILGSQWSEVAIYLKLFSLSIPPQIVVGISGGIFQAYEKGRELLLSSLIGAIFFGVAVLIGVLALDVEIMIILIVIAFYFHMFVCFYFLYVNVLGRRYMEFLLLFYYLFVPVFLIYMIDYFFILPFNFYGFSYFLLLMLACLVVFLSFFASVVKGVCGDE